MEQREGSRRKKVDYEIGKKVVLSEVKKGLKLTLLLQNALPSSPSSSTLSLVNHILSCFENSLSALNTSFIPPPNQRSREDNNEGVNVPTANICGEQPPRINTFEMEHVWAANGVLNSGNVTQVVPHLAPSSSPLYGHEEFAFDPLVWDILPSFNPQSDRPL